MSRKRLQDPDWRFSRRDLNRCGADGKRLFLTIEDTARHFGISLHAVLEWCKLGVVPEHRVGGRTYLNREEVRKYWEMFQGRR
jgi:excisionase family DNA binding protein